MAISKRGDGWIVQVRDLNGKFFERKVFDTKSLAREYEGELLGLRARGGKAAAQVARELTFGDYWERWSNECRTKTSDGWQLSQNQMYRDHISPYLQDKALAEIDRTDIFGVLKKAEVKGLGPQMRKHIFMLLHKMFSDAIEHFELLDSSPCRLALKPVVPKVERSFMKPDEARRFLDFAADDYLGKAVWIMLLCGLRVGEVQALQWKNVDLKSGVLFIARQWNRKERRFKLPKNGEQIRVPMPPDLVDYLSGQKPLGVDPDELVMTNQKDGGLVHYDTIEDGIKRICKSGKFALITPHELRHSCSELWIEAGASKEDIRRLFNHRSDAATDTYIHKTNERLGLMSQAVVGKRVERRLRAIK